MCLAIYKPKNKALPKEYAQAGFGSNKDGAGFAYVKNGELIISKGFMTFAKFWDAFDPIQKYEAIIHFRYATNGAVETANTHPFKIAGGFALVHNGIIGIKELEGKTDSETYGTLVLSPLIEKYGVGILEQPSFRFMLETSITESKFILLSAKSHYIFNEDTGLWDDGIWYSNKGYIPSISTWDYSTYLDEYEKDRTGEEYDAIRLMSDEAIELRLSEIYNVIDEMDDATAEELFAEQVRLEYEQEYRFESLDYMESTEYERQTSKYGGAF